MMDPRIISQHLLSALNCEELQKKMLFLPLHSLPDYAEGTITFKKPVGRDHDGSVGDPDSPAPTDTPNLPTHGAMSPEEAPG